MFAKTKIPLLALAYLAASVASYGEDLHPRLGVGILGISASLGLGDDGDDSSTSSSFTLPPGGPFISTPPSFSITPTRTRSSSSSFSSTPTTTTSSSSSSSESTTKASTWTSKFTTSSTSPITTTIVKTSGGSTTTDVVTSSKVVESTGTKTGTTLPQLNGDGGGDDDDGGLSDGDVKVIAGVVGGVGGALVIGIIVFVVWRLKVKARRSEEQEDLMAGQENSLKYTSPAATVNTNSPFTSTLDQYHNPGGRVNPSSNF